MSTLLSEVISPRAAEPKSSTRLTGLPRNADWIASRIPVAVVALILTPLCCYQSLDHRFRCQSRIVNSGIAIGGSISLFLKKRWFVDGMNLGEFPQPLYFKVFSRSAREGHPCGLHLFAPPNLHDHDHTCPLA